MKILEISTRQVNQAFDLNLHYHQSPSDFLLYKPQEIIRSIVVIFKQAYGNEITPIYPKHTTLNIFQFIQ